jgi:hypothetical protein
VDRKLEPNVKKQHYVWRHYLNAWAPNAFFATGKKRRNFFQRNLPPSQAKRIFISNRRLRMATSGFWMISSAAQATNAFVSLIAIMCCSASYASIFVIG